jgi:hypothetical protein
MDLFAMKLGVDISHFEVEGLGDTGPSKRA